MAGGCDGNRIKKKSLGGLLSSIEGQPQVRQPSVAGDPGEDPGEMQRKASYRWQPPAQHAGTKTGSSQQGKTVTRIIAAIATTPDCKWK